MEFLTLVFAGVALAIGYFLFLRDKRPANYPPGPKGLPIIGNVHQMPRDECEYVRFTKWAKVYGPIYSVKLANIDVVVLSDPILIRDAFNDPATTGRPNNPVFRAASGGDHGVLAVDGQTWAEQRRFTLRHLRDFGFGKNAMETLILDEAKELVDGFKTDEGKSIALTRRFNVAILNSLWMIVTGTRFDHDDPRGNAILEDFFKGLDQAFVQGILWLAPWLRFVAPEMSGWNTLNRAIDNLNGFLNGIVGQHEKTLVEGQPRDFIDSFLSEMQKNKNPESSFTKEKGYKNLLAVIGDLFAAGGETTSTTMDWSVLFLASHPHVQKELQREIDEVIGQSRLPSLSDKANMPYTEAVMMEILRKSSIASVSLFHTVTQDTKIGGYDIPKGTFLLPVFWWCHHNPKYWDSPDEFKPERFLGADKRTIVKNDALMPFSVGKRVCLGETLARDEFFLFLTCIFQRFNVEMDPSKPVSFECLNTFITKPKPFNVIMHDRFTH